MQSVVAFSLKQRVFYNLMFVVLMVVGFITLFALPAERYPNFGFGEVIISTVYPGASPVEVESLVTRKIEEAVERVDDVEWINATSFSGRSHLRLKFVDDSDYDSLFNEVRFEVLNIINELPEGVDPPRLLNAKVQDWLPVISVNLIGEHSNRALALMSEEVKILLLKIPGVQQVEFSGELTQEFHVFLDPEKLRLLGVSFDQVAEALGSANLTIPAGKYTNKSGEFLIKLDERFRSLEQVQSTVVRRDSDGSLLRVEDIASRIGLDYRDPVAIASVNGKPSIGLKVIKSDEGNAMDIRDRVVAVVDSFRPSLTEQGVDVVLTQDSTVYIKDGLNTLGMNMLVGITLVSLIIWYFMGVRNAGLVTIGIPFSFMITMLIMYLTGNSLNEITLFSFVLVTGIVVDDAIVVTENIYRHVQEGKPLREAIIEGTAEVAVPVIAATMTTVAAFLPMLIMTGSTGQFFALVPKAVTFAIVASLVECLLILPIHYYDFGPRQQASTDLIERDNALMRLARRFTDWLLNLTLQYRLLSVSIVLAVFIASVVILSLSASGKAPLIRIQFFPDDYKLYYVDLIGPSSVPIEEVNERVKQISETILQDGPGMAKATSGFAGLYFNEDYEPIYGNNHGSVMVTMPSVDDQTFDDPLDHLERMREKLTPLYEKDGYRISIHPQSDGPPSGKDINVRVVGANVASVSALAKALLAFMRESPDIGTHLLDLKDDRGEPKRVFRLEVNQQRVAEYGLDNSRVAMLAASVLDGRYIGKYRHVDEEIDLKLYVDPGSLESPEQALSVPMVEDAGRPVYLSDLVDVRAYNEAGEIKRYQGQRAISLKADIREGAPTSTPAIVNAVRDHYEQVREGYPGATVTFGGEHEDTQRSFESLGYAFIIAVLVMYVILATQFQSYLQPLIILSAVVFALIGVVFGKLVTQTLFTINSFVAVIGVAGVVVNDALVLIDFINKRYRSGMMRREAIVAGVHIRLRPILLTTLTTTLGLLPMAIGFPSYSLIWGTMASTFVTGLAAATALTLFIIPVLWDLLQGLQESIQKRRDVRSATWNGRQ
ncbi:MAG: efflux RND transporter permease subunit [Candidatus Thiodiazotropha sp. (ex Monitilora ramsayi)]|nr:efflux RND transporter permease subunit [Candidatus Thiodiazotropha sp. (ex Monitilora ramsayi)]